MKTKNYGQRGIALVIAMLFLAVIAIFITVFMFMSQHETQLTTIEEKSEKAFYYANAGIHDVTFKLSQNQNYGTTNPYGSYSTVLTNVVFDSGDYTIRIKNTIDSTSFVTIEALGTDQNKRRRIELVLKKTVVDNPDVHFKHAVFSDGDLTLHGGITVTGDLHANGDLNQTGGSAVINGNVSASGTVTSGGTISGYESSNAAKEHPISFNFDLYKSVAENGGKNTSTGAYLYSTGAVFDNYDTLLAYLNSHQTAGTPAGLVYYNGNLTVSEDIYIEGTIVVNGTFDLQGATITHARDDVDGDGIGNPFAVAATGNITFSGKSETTDGVVFTNGNFTLNGNSGMGNGSLFAKGGILNGGGNQYNLAFDSTLLDLVIPGVGTDQLTTYSWKELAP